ncbi:MAG TPA: tetratricopeptide repeat protein [Bryobacteraceae bacterium]|jgi:tetratricopeptide (TPR) repeat protein
MRILALLAFWAPLGLIAAPTQPPSAQSYKDLAAKLCRQARDNGDVTVYDRAWEALQHSLQLSPGNYDAQKLEVTVLIGRREFSQALKLASEVNAMAHDDIAGWGLLVDANIALGSYDAAERAAQWILDLRPGSSLGFEKAAILRGIFGDPEGASEYFDEAYRRTSPNDVDQRAWLLTQNARAQLAAGNRKRAEQLLDEALQLYPDSQSAAATLAKVRASK